MYHFISFANENSSKICFTILCKICCCSTLQLLQLISADVQIMTCMFSAERCLRKISTNVLFRHEIYKNFYSKFSAEIIVQSESGK